MNVLNQRLEQRRLLLPQLHHSLKILALALPDISAMLSQELEVNPFLEESGVAKSPNPKLSEYVFVPVPVPAADAHETRDYVQEILSQKTSLFDVLNRQLAMFADSDADISLGQEIIGNIDANGYLAVPLAEIAAQAGVPLSHAERVLSLIQKFEPAGVAARSPRECLLIQLEMSQCPDLLLRKIIEEHLDDVAKKNYTRIAKALHEPVEVIEQCAARLQRFDPKPGRAYATDTAYRVIPDVIITDKGDSFDIAVNNEDLPSVQISKDYRALLKDPSLDQRTRDFLKEKLKTAQDLLRSISRRKLTLRTVIEEIVSVQEEAVRCGLSELKPLTLGDVAARIGMHESTVSRATMNKYCRLPCGETVPLKAFFPAKIQSPPGEAAVSSARIKGMIVETIKNENAASPLSDQEIADRLRSDYGMRVSRRTVAKYREELKLLSSAYRRKR
jgi:RNA polymerase sigma-54 factor